MCERPDAIVFAAFRIAPDRYALAVGRVGRHLVAKGAPAPHHVRLRRAFSVGYQGR